jgi:hypothetical protein
MKRLVQTLAVILALAAFTATATAYHIAVEPLPTGGYAVEISGDELMYSGTLTVSYDPDTFKMRDCRAGDLLSGAMVALNKNFRSDAVRLSWVSADGIPTDGTLLTLMGTGDGKPVIESLKITDADGEAISSDQNAEIVGSENAPPEQDTLPEHAGLLETIQSPAAITPAAPKPGTAPEMDTGQNPITSEMTKTEREKGVIVLQIGNSIAVHDGHTAKIDPDNEEVVPYIANERILVPIRFIAETLGAQVEWLEDTREALIVRDQTTVKLKIGGNKYTVNGVEHTSDAGTEIRQNRTFVPMRFVAETLGEDVYWDAENRLAIISSADNPWQPERKAEQDALADIQLLLSPLLKPFL